MSGSGTRDDPWRLKTPPGQSEFEAWRDEDADPPALVVQVGKSELRYHLRAIDDLHGMLKERGDWVPLGSADEQKPAAEGTVEARGRADDNPVGGWYGLKKGMRGRFGNYVPPVLEELGLAEVEHNARNNRMRARGESADVPRRVRGQLDVTQTYNDGWRGWPVLPLHRQHPIRGSFLDPRPDPRVGAIYHNGVDIGVRDDIPGRGAPPGRTHRVHAIEGGRVTAATPRGVRGLIDAGHFRYEHVDALVQVGDTVEPGQHIGWTWKESWHVHLSEFVFGAGGSRVFVNPLRREGKLHPYADSAPPRIEEVRFYAPATPTWGRRPANVARLPQAGRRLDRARLSSRVDVRVRTSDPQSFIGWFASLPWLAAPHHPHRIAVTLRSHATGRAVVDRDVFRSERMLTLPAGQHFAPGTEQNLPANGCMSMHRRVRCDGIYWFRLFPAPYWDTTRLPNGGYRIRIRVWDVAGNEASDDTDVRIRN